MEILDELLKALNLKQLEILLNNKYPKRNVVWQKVDVRNYLHIYDSKLPTVKGDTDDEKALNGLKWIVSHMRYVTDSRQYKMSEYWAHPYQTMKTKKGDCEDGTLLLYSILVKSGVPYYKLRVACGDTSVGGHAYLTYYHEDKSRWVTLDWCYWPNFKTVIERPDWKDDKLYGKVWFSFNHKYCYSTKDKSGIRGIIITKEVLKQMVFDWKKTGWKFGKAAVYVIIAGLAVVYGNNPLYLAIAPVLHGVENWLKHK